MNIPKTLNATMMKYIIIFTAVIVVSQFLTIEMLRSQVSRASQPIIVNSLLWKIEGNGLRAPSYLYGTIHLICEHDVAIGKSIRHAFKATKQLAMEIDMGKLDNGDMFDVLQKGALMKGDTTLEMLLDTTSMEFLRAYFQDSLGVPLFPPMNRIKPMFLATMLLQEEAECKQTSYEEEFVVLARKQKKSTLGIETVEEQLALFDYLSYKQQAEMLVKDLKSVMNPDTPTEVINLKSITVLYKEGKISELLNVLRTQEAGEFEEVLLNRRNRSWIPILERMIRLKPTFIAVGAGHLAGEQGIINLLRKQGFTLTPVR